MSTIEKNEPLKREQIQNGKVLFIPSGMAHHTIEKSKPPYFVLSIIVGGYDTFVRWENEYGFCDAEWEKFLSSYEGLYVRLPNLQDVNDRKAISNWGSDLQGEIAQWTEQYHSRLRATNLKIKAYEALINRFPP